MRRHTALLVLHLFPLGVIAGCTTPRLLDAGLDAGLDAAADGGLDAAGPDGGPDGGADGGSDAGPPPPPCRNLREACSAEVECSCRGLTCADTESEPGVYLCRIPLGQPCTSGLDCAGHYDCQQHNGTGAFHCCSWYTEPVRNCSSDYDCCGGHFCNGGVCT